MAEDMTLRQWQKAFAKGEFAAKDFNTQVAAGWYDWFCKTDALAKKTATLGSIVEKLADGGKVDLDGTNVWFKNNCPLVGPLYDDIRISDDEGNLFVISIADAREDLRYTVYSYLNDYAAPVYSAKDKRSLVKWLNTPWEEVGVC